MPATRTLTTFFGLGATAYWLRRQMLRWGASEEERRAPPPGAELIPEGRLGSTMATTIAAPPARVWPWLVQMGFDRGGWYSWDRLDRHGIPSTWTLQPEWQSLSVGQRLQADRKGKFWFEVAALEPERFLALRSAMTPLGRQYDSAGPRPRYFSDGLWTFELKPLSGDRTRLVVRTYGATRPRWFGRLVGFLFWEPAHWIMQARQFTNLKQRAEHPSVERREAAPTTAPAAP
jgi:hypothetical protein